MGAAGAGAVDSEHTPLHRRVRGLLGGWVGSGRRSSASGGGALGPLVSAHVEQHPGADVPTLERAYAVAEELHRGQRRKSGEPFITHPLAVATILANLGLDTTTLVAALLHDTVEDTRYTLTATQQDFGPRSAHWSTASRSWTRSASARTPEAEAAQNDRRRRLGTCGSW